MTKINTDTVREQLTSIGEEMTRRHLGEQMREITLGGILCVLSKRHMLLYGPHGANKSRVIEDLIERVDGAATFVNPGSAYAVVEDLLGPIKLSGLDHDKYVRNPEGRIQQAHYAFMDEVFEVNDALVKTLHPIMNERRTSDDGKWHDVPLECMFGATNVTVEDAIEGKAAFVDRWHLRYCLVYPEDPKEIEAILKMAYREQTKKPKRTKTTLEGVLAAQQEVLKVDIPDDVFKTIIKIVRQLGAKGVKVSPRRLVQCLPILQASAWFRGHEAVDNSDLAIFRHALWEEERHIDHLVKILAVEAKSHISQSKELLDDVKRLQQKHSQMKEGDPDAAKLLEQVHQKAQKLSKLETEYASQGKDTREISKAYEAVQKIHYEMLQARK